MEQLFGWIEEYGMLAVYVAVYLESACFPLPSEVVLPLAGALAAQGGLAFGPFLMVATVFCLLGSLTCYCIGRMAGTALLSKAQARFPKLQKGLEASRDMFQRHGGAAVLVGRLIPVCRTYISFVAGMLKQNVVSFTLYSGAGIVVWNALLLGAGYLLKDNWGRVETFYAQYKPFAIGIVTVLMGAAVARWYQKHGKRQKNAWED